MDSDTPETAPTDSTAPKTGERIAKALSRRGVASRRDAERMILQGRVSVNGKVVTSPALDVTPGDRLVVDGKPVPEAEPTRLWLYHKPPGLVTTDADEQGRPTIYEGLPEGMPRVMSVGRLDLTSEGLLLLTNDGTAKRRLELPETGWLRRYRVRINGAVSEADLDRLRAGLTVEGVDYQPMEVSFDRQQGANAWLTVGLREGKNREIRRVMEALGVTVNRLIRVSYGPFQLGELAPGAVEEVPRRRVRDQLGLEGASPQPLRSRKAALAGAGAGAAGKAGHKRPLKGNRPAPTDRPARSTASRSHLAEGPKSAPGKAARPRPLDTDRAQSARPAKPRWTKEGDRPGREHGPGQAAGTRPGQDRPQGHRQDDRAAEAGGGKPRWTKDNRANGPQDRTSGPRSAKPRTGPADADRPKWSGPRDGASSGAGDRKPGHPKGRPASAASQGHKPRTGDGRDAGPSDARGKPRDTGRPDKAAPRTGGKSWGQDKSGTPGKPRATGKPGTTGKPVSGSRPGTTGKPGFGGRPGTGGGERSRGPEPGGPSRGPGKPSGRPTGPRKPKD
ncbi:MAG: pseudouridine synthase [Rubellimicrobium sp.]|nr:pseudouridine synthase [Rubellimicrobium sp.]